MNTLQENSTVQSNNPLKITGAADPKLLGYVKPAAKLDTKKFTYMAARVSGNCLSTRPIPANHGDTIFIREIKDWDVMDLSNDLYDYLGKLVAVIIRRQPVIKELVHINFLSKTLVLRQFNPSQDVQIQFEDILKVFAVDAIESSVQIINP